MKMKKLAFAAFVAFCASVASLLAVEWLSPGPAAPGETGLPTHTLDEVSRHSDEASCWMAIEGDVYDLTDYLPAHPAPSAVMLQWCGREATEGMRTKGYGRDHSAAAWAMLDGFRIGRLAE